MTTQFLPPLRLALLVTAALALPGAVHGQVLLLNFGTSGSTVTSAQATNAPYATGLSSTSVWNQVVTADVLTGLSFANGASATGVTVDLGASGDGFATGASSLNFATQPTGNNAGIGTAGQTLIPANSPGRDFSFTGSSGQNTAFGVRVGGLAAGTYNVYVAGWNSAGATQNQAQSFYLGATPALTTTLAIGSLGGFTTESIANSSFVAPWTESTNFSMMSVTLGAGDYLTVISNGTSGDFRGFMSLLEIVAVPEPTGATMALLALASLSFARRRTRR